MATAQIQIESPPLPLHFEPVVKRMSDDEFFEFCQLNREWRFELTSEGDLIVMSPTGSRTGKRNFRMAGLFYAWVEANGTGVGFDSSTGFTLPNDAKRSPDLAWIRKPRWEALTETEQEVFAPLCPDFVIELRSPSDDLARLQAKLQEYIDNGAQLGWLIDPLDQHAYIYESVAGEV